MSIIRNVYPDPSFENTGSPAWTARSGTYATTEAYPLMQGRVGARVGEATTTAGNSHNALYLESTATVYISAGQWAAARIWIASEPDVLTYLRLVFQDLAGVEVARATSTVAAAGFYQGRYVDLVTQAPATARRVQVVIGAYRSGENMRLNDNLWADQLALSVEWLRPAAEQGIASGYHDGDSPGWVWEGTPHASASRGPAAPYSHDGELRDTAGKRLAWLDLIAGYEATSESRMAVQTSLGTFPKQFARGGNAGPRVGTLRIHFTRELADGTPAGRSLAVEQLLRQGVARQLVVNMDPGVGPTDFAFYPTGRIVRRLEHATGARGPAARAVWTVECEFTEVIP